MNGQDQLSDDFKKVMDCYWDNINSISHIYHCNLFKLDRLNDLIISELLYGDVPEGSYFSEIDISDLELNEDVREYVNDLIEIEKIIDDISFFEHYDDGAVLTDLFSIEDSIDFILGEASSDLSKYLFEELISKKEFRRYIIPEVNFSMHSNNSNNDAFENFSENGLISSCCYVDNVSIFDFHYMFSGKFRRGYHLNELSDDLNVAISSKKDKLTQDVINIIDRIEKLINRKYNFPLQSFRLSSGSKQIVILLVLLNSEKLKRDGYLIIDEPEVNLHPDWQFKFAEILVLLAKDLNITVYLNSHSPFFIESIDAFTEYYDMQDDVNYYLTEESENEGKYNFTRINSDELYRIYDNLGDAYKLIDQLRIRKRLDR